MSEFTVAANFERPLTDAELNSVMRRAPDLVYYAPAQECRTAYWFEVTANLSSGRAQSVAVFYVRADSLGAAKQHAHVVLDRHRSEIAEHFGIGNDRFAIQVNQ